jgi:hypothetical protein
MINKKHSLSFGWRSVAGTEGQLPFIIRPDPQDKILSTLWCAAYAMVGRCVPHNKSTAPKSLYYLFTKEIKKVYAKLFEYPDNVLDYPSIERLLMQVLDQLEHWRLRPLANL